MIRDVVQVLAVKSRERAGLGVAMKQRNVIRGLWSARGERRTDVTGMVRRSSDSSRWAPGRFAVAIMLVASVFFSVLVGPPPAAFAAVLSDAITSIRFESTGQVNVGSILKFEGTWAVPDSAQSGDTFQLQLPSELKWRGATTFDLTLCPSGSGACSNIVVATAQVSDSGLVTFTLSNYVNDKVNVTGSFYFTTEFAGHNTDGKDQKVTFSGSLPSNIDIDLPMADPLSSLKLTKLASPATFLTKDTVPGQIVNYTFRVTNTGQQKLTGVTVTDPGPKRGGVQSDGQFTAPVCAARPNTIDRPCNPDGKTVDLLPGESTTFTASYTITQADIDSGQALSNTARATGTDVDGKLVSTSATASVRIGTSAWGRTLGGTNALVASPQKYMWWQSNPVDRDASSQVGAVVRSGFIPRDATATAHTLTFTEHPDPGLAIDCSTIPYALVQPVGRNGNPSPINDAEYEKRVETVTQEIVSCAPEELVYTVNWVSAASATPADPGGVAVTLYLALKVTDWSLAAVADGGNGQGYLNTAIMTLDGESQEVTAKLIASSDNTNQPPNNEVSSEKLVEWVDENTEDQIHVRLFGPVTSATTSTVVLTERLTTPGQRIDCTLASNADPRILYGYWQLGSMLYVYQQATRIDGSIVRGTITACSETSITVQVDDVPPLVNVGVDFYVDIDTSNGRYPSYGDEGNVQIVDKAAWSETQTVTRTDAGGVGSGLKPGARVETVASTTNASDPKLLPYTGDDGVIQDSVNIVSVTSGLTPGMLHAIRGVLYDETTGALVTDRDGATVFGTANSDGTGGLPTFTSTAAGESPSSGVPVYFRVPVEVSGHTLVVFQYVFDDEDLLAAYADDSNYFGYSAGDPNALIARAAEQVEVEAAPGEISWTKVDADSGLALAGAVFTVTGPAGYSVRMVDNVGQPAYVGLDSDSRPGHFTLLGLIPGTNVSQAEYVISEAIAPKGYVLDPRSITLRAHDPQTGAEPAWPEFVNERKTGTLSWAKSIAGNSLSRLPGSVWRLSGPNNYCELIVDAQSPVNISDLPDYGSCNSSGVDAGLTAGSFVVSDLEWGSYTLVEVKAPPGYQVDQTPHVFEVTVSNLTVNLGSLENTQKLGQLVWAKIDASGGKSLAGSTWLLTGPEGYREEIADNGKNDNDAAGGMFAVDGLRWGSYALTEILAPEGYKLEAEPYLLVVNAGNDAVGDFGPILNVRNGSPSEDDQQSPSNSGEGGGALSRTGVDQSSSFLLGTISALLLLGSGLLLQRRRKR